MKRPQIHERIEKQRNIIGAAATFLAVGGSALLAIKGLSTLPVLVASLPLFVDVFSLNSLNKKAWDGKTLLHFCDRTFKMRMGGWIKNYINKTDDLIEKKYRALFLHAWFDQRQMPMKELVPAQFHEFEKLFGELRNTRLTKFPIYISTGSSFMTDITNFINEDKNEPEKFAKIKKIYSEYAVEGALGKALVENGQFIAYSMLSDHKLTSLDYEAIEQYNPRKNSFKRLALFEDTVKEIRDNILEKENNIKHLQILYNYCNRVLEPQNSSLSDKQGIIDIQNTIKSKIKYIELNSEMESKDDNPKKSKSIKI